jgi:hypothetical protein
MDNFSPEPLGNDGCPDGQVLVSWARSFFALAINLLDTLHQREPSAISSHLSASVFSPDR